MRSRVQRISVRDADVGRFRGGAIGVLGFGNQGEAHALNLRDSGCAVIVGQRPGRRFDAARAAGFEPVTVAEAVRRSEVLICGLPDDAAPRVYAEEIRPHLRGGHTLGFIHGFTIRFGQIVPPPEIDVVLVAPKAQGRAVRSEYVAGRGVLALIAVHQDASGRALDTALAWAAGIGAARAGVLETTFADETETDLFGEQAVLCGGLASLIKTAFETLVEAGYPEELAYLECCHEVKLIADLIYEGGLTTMRERISSTARFGDVTRGPRVVGATSREEMQRLLDEIRNGEFARELVSDNETGRSRAVGLVEQDRGHAIERVGATLREMMWGATRR